MILRIVRLPPVLFFGFLLAGLGAGRIAPVTLGVPSFELGMAVGCGLLFAGVAIAWAALSEFRKHGTTEEPGQRPSALITRGVFAFSRNPLYVALLFVMSSLAVMVDSIWLIASAALLGLTLDRFIIRSEEQILEEAFPEEYRAYKARVRRWV